MAPTGVLSSWLTLATKSRRVGLHPGVLGLVVDVDHREPAIVLGQQPHVAAHRECRSARRAGACAATDRPRRLSPVVSVRCAATQARSSSSRSRTRPSSRGPVIDVDHVTVGVDDDDPHAGTATRCAEASAKRDAGLLGGRPLPALPDAGRDAHADRRSPSTASRPRSRRAAAPTPHSRENRTHPVNVIPAACGQIGTSHRPKRRMFGSPFTCVHPCLPMTPLVTIGRLLGALGGHRRGAGGRGLGIQVQAAGHRRLEVLRPGRSAAGCRSGC